MLAKADRDASLCHRISDLSLSARTKVRDHLEELVEDPVFRGSRRCHDLLRFVVDNALDEKFDHLKERIIGMEVFGRPAEYDTAVDSVVRVTANEVRKRLAQFYVERPPGDSVRIELPVGSYIPEFHLQPDPAVPASPPQAAETSSRESPENGSAYLDREISVIPVPQNGGRPHKLLLQGFLLVCLICVLSNAWWWRHVSAIGRNGWIASDPDLPETLPWSALLNGSDRPISLVLADVSVGTSQELLGRQLSLPEYIGRDFLVSAAGADREAMVLAEMMSQRPYTSATDAALASQLLKLHPVLNRRVNVLFARDVRIEELSGGNTILLGAGYANLWEQLMQRGTNFRIEFDKDSGMHVCVNRSPAPGEAERYVAAGPTGTTGVAYAVVSLLPNPRDNGHVLLLAGTNTEGTREAGEFVMHREEFAKALKQMGVDPRGPVRHFEILLRLNAVGGSSYYSEIVSYRLFPAGG